MTRAPRPVGPRHPPQFARRQPLARCYTKANSILRQRNDIFCAVGKTKIRKDRYWNSGIGIEPEIESELTPTTEPVIGFRIDGEYI
ncbi:hypothetical protein EVAR_4133_1 [Eumeta japonica]|uniref:Uncharacterized protein n=1 Tax=Eumeta variegata TaxID=151549 RepID=A0A4C1ZXJ5_EUMVA|nr:hypothetical protein EVAR_4133_1 [Eumeta japonica]